MRLHAIAAAVTLSLATCGAPPPGAPPVGHPVVPSPLPVDVVGRWYLVAGLHVVDASALDGRPGRELDGTRLTLDLHDATRDGQTCGGSLTDETAGNAGQPLLDCQWDGATRTLRFSAFRGGSVASYRAPLVAGVLSGRYAVTDGQAPAAVDYQDHVSGWNSTFLDGLTVARTYDLRLADGRRAMLRLDRTHDGQWIGNMKVYAVPSLSGDSAIGEGPSVDLSIERASAESVAFRYQDGPSGEDLSFNATLGGRRIEGTYVGDDVSHSFSGTRADVLGYGIAVKLDTARSAWRERVRSQLLALTMAGNPSPVAGQPPPSMGPALSPIATGFYPLRDDEPTTVDDVDRWAAASYTLRELTYDFTVEDPHGPDPLHRAVHGYLAMPTTPMPPGGYPLAIAVNGHGGSAYQVFDPASIFWYGDAFARRGFAVLAIDISHRPLADRVVGLSQGTALYGTNDYGSSLHLSTGDDAIHGNGPHPAIRSPGFDSDWEEDGERTWDVMHAMDFLFQRGDINHSHPIITGLSMGGEIATLVAALDPRIGIAIPAGYSFDYSVYSYDRAVFPSCWRWMNADIREYVDDADYLALIAPRPLLVETGIDDKTFSQRTVAPFASDKQVARRARAAYGEDQSNLLHYLHDGRHVWDAGDHSVFATSDAWGIQQPVAIDPDDVDPLAWQFDSQTVDDRETVFDWIGRWLLN